ncbi:hypothetical protein [Geobacillus jurassicus]|uniref:Uncharacterized protein n=1 Tax=Geobacillus jurassicus TaxID=235932 RepID=A0ABV6GUJ7_9BACL|nr:hypothetical protein [Geobacillus jurassicus]
MDKTKLYLSDIHLPLIFGLRPAQNGSGSLLSGNDKPAAAFKATGQFFIHVTVLIRFLYCRPLPAMV